MNQNSNKQVLTHNLSRTGFDETIESSIIHIICLVGYLIVFGIFIPYVLLKHKAFVILEGYMPNLDLIACVLGYSEGPFGAFKYLYNPATNSVSGIVSSLVINYTALLGATFVVAYYTLKTGNLMNGWSRSFIMLLATYLIPGYFIAYFMFYFGDKLSPYFPIGSLGNWVVTVAAGFVLIFFIIILEGYAIEKLTPAIVQVLDRINRTIQRF